jgi:hypothetical protein
MVDDSGYAAHLLSVQSILSIRSFRSSLFGLFGLFGSATKDEVVSLELFEADVVDVEGSFPVVAGDEEHEMLDVS